MSEESKEELDDMPIWQNHEQRITALEITTANINSEFTEIKKKIDDGNFAQNEKLERIDSKLMDEFFKKKRDTRNNVWKVIITIVGGLLGVGGLVYAISYFAIKQLLGG